MRVIYHTIYNITQLSIFVFTHTYFAHACSSRYPRSSDREDNQLINAATRG